MGGGSVLHEFFCLPDSLLQRIHGLVISKGTQPSLCASPSSVSGEQTMDDDMSCS